METVKFIGMQIITIHDTETEEIIGSVTPVDKIDFDKFHDEVYTSWVSFNSVEENLEDYTIEDFVEFHNLNSNTRIDQCIGDYIQL